MKKKIIFITKALWIGGIETALVNLLNCFDYSKYDVTLLILHAELDLIESITPQCRILIIDREKIYSFKQEYPHKSLFHLTEKPTNPSMLHKMLMWIVPGIKFVENELYIHYVRQIMKNEYFDTAIIYNDAVAEIGIRGIRANKYMMFYHHGAMRHTYHDKIAYKKCDKIISVSKNQENELKAFLPKYAGKIYMIHNLVDIERIRLKSLSLIEEKFDTSKFNIVSVGRVAYEKGMDIAVYACAQLVADGYNNVCWWIVGDGPAMLEIKQIVAKLHLENNVMIVGMKSNPYPYIRQADLYVQPSRYESFGLTIKEAMILGKAVVATKTAGSHELIKDGIDGSRCDVSWKSVAKTIEFLYENPELMAEYREYLQLKCFELENEKALVKLYGFIDESI